METVVIFNTKVLAIFTNSSDAWQFVANKIEGKSSDYIDKFAVSRKDLL